MANTNLKEAKAAKNDEFYTQFHDIEIEMNAYLEYDPDVFRGKIVLLPCDDPEWSNFTRYFAAKFDELGLKKLISTSYAPDSKKYKTPYQPSLFEQEAPQFDPSKAQVKGKIFILERDKSGDGRINIDDLEWKYMEGDGDFRSKEVTELRNEADFIITNPPFSLFREFLAWIVEAGKKFAVIGKMVRKQSQSPYVVGTSIQSKEPRSYRDYFGRLLKRLDIPHLVFHGLRHTFATRCIESQCDYKTVSVILGHSNVATTLNLYVHPNLNQKKRCIDRMSNFLGIT